jgi:hypothetical protein
MYNIYEIYKKNKHKINRIFSLINIIFALFTVLYAAFVFLALPTIHINVIVNMKSIIIEPIFILFSFIYSFSVFIMRKLTDKYMKSLLEAIPKSVGKAYRKFLTRNQSNLTFDNIRNTTNQDLFLITESAHAAFDIVNHKKCEPSFLREKNVRKAYFDRLFKINNEIFTKLEFHNIYYGYFSIIPLKTYDHYFGQQSQYDLNENDVCAKNEQYKLLYIQAILLPPLKINGITEKDKLNALYTGIIKKIAEYNITDRTVIYAERFSPRVENLLTHAGFYKNKRKSIDKKEFWEFTLENLKESDTDLYDKTFKSLKKFILIPKKI